MIEKYEKKVLQLNAPLRGLPVGAKVPIKVDKDGTPVDRYWRDRLKEATKDKCVEFVGKKSTTRTATASTPTKTEVNKDVD